MNVLTRNKEVARGLSEGKSYGELARIYRVDATAIRQRYEETVDIIDRPFYDVVASMDFPDSLGGKLVHALYAYELTNDVELTPDFIAVRMSNLRFSRQRGVGKVLTKALAQLQEHILKERAAQKQDIFLSDLSKIRQEVSNDRSKLCP